MSQAGYTPIQLYFSTTAAAVPVNTNLANGELAINITDGKLYYKDNGGTVRLLASNATSAPVLSFQTSLSGLTPSTATTGVVTLAGTLGVASGGTGLTTLATGSLPYGAGTSAFSALAIGTAGQILTVNSGATAPQWSTLSGVAVTTFSAGTTGLTPSTATAGAVTLAGTLATTNGGTGLTSFTSGGVVYASSSSALATGSGLVFDGTNLGLGVTPSASWLGKAFEINGVGNAIWSPNAINDIRVVSNTKYNAGVQYAANGYANGYYCGGTDGTHTWYNAPSGTAGNPITFTAAMKLDASGRLLVGTTSTTTSSSQSGEVYSAGAVGFLLTNTTAANYALSVKNEGTSGTRAFINFYEGTGGGTSRANISFDGSNNFVFTASNATIFTNGGSERGRFESTGTFVIKNDYQEQTYTANSSTAITLNIVTNGTDQVITLTGTATITMPTATAGKSFLLKLRTGAGGYTVTWSTVKWPGGTAPTLTSTASRMDIFSFFADGTNWYGTTVGQNYTP